MHFLSLSTWNLQQTCCFGNATKNSINMHLLSLSTWNLQQTCCFENATKNSINMHFFSLFKWNLQQTCCFGNATKNSINMHFLSLSTWNLQQTCCFENATIVPLKSLNKKLVLQLNVKQCYIKLQVGTKMERKENITYLFHPSCRQWFHNAKLYLCWPSKLIIQGFSTTKISKTFGN
jgi:hypothetical protein